MYAVKGWRGWADRQKERKKERKKNPEQLPGRDQLVKNNVEFVLGKHLNTAFCFDSILATSMLCLPITWGCL